MSGDDQRRGWVGPETEFVRIVAAAWHEYRYPRPALDEPTGAFERAVRVALDEVAATRSPAVDREALARIAHGPQVPLHPIEGIPSPWQAVEQALDRLISAGAIAGTTPTAPAEGREALIAVLASAICRRRDPHADDGLTPTMTGPEAAYYADALISAGWVRGPVEQPPPMPPVGGQKLALAIYQDGLANGCHQNTIARKLLARYDIRERGEVAGARSPGPELFDYSALRNTRSDEPPESIARSAWVDVQHRDNVGGKHQQGFCRACADAGIAAQDLFPMLAGVRGSVEQPATIVPSKEH